MTNEIKEKTNGQLNESATKLINELKEGTNRHLN